MSNVSVGTFGDLKGRNEPRHEIDPNPSIECATCDQSFNFQDYWDERYVDGQDPALAHECEWICDDCLDRMYTSYELVKQQREHKQLTEF